MAVGVSVFHKQLVDWLRPISMKVRTVAWGWIIPVLVLFAVSFPPLFGGEIIAVLCGIVYGVWIGFGIVACGTLLGEIGNFYVFRFLLQNTAIKAERKSMTYASFADIIRNGNFFLLLATRLSAIPSHVTTAVFATVGMGFWMFLATAVLSLPKYLSVVYLGVALDGSKTVKNQHSGSRAVQIGVVVGVITITVVIAFFLVYKMDKVKPLVQKRIRKERYERLIEAATPSEPSSCMSTPYFEASDPFLSLDIKHSQSPSSPASLNVPPLQPRSPRLSPVYLPKINASGR